MMMITALFIHIIKHTITNYKYMLCIITKENNKHTYQVGLKIADMDYYGTLYMNQGSIKYENKLVRRVKLQLKLNLS